MSDVSLGVQTFVHLTIYTPSKGSKTYHYKGGIKHGRQFNKFFVSELEEFWARYTLDYHPGRSMTIDFELNNGEISEEEAKERRKALNFLESELTQMKEKYKKELTEQVN